MQQPFGKMVIDGIKSYDSRNVKVKADKQGVPLFLISDGMVLGEMMITKCVYNQTRHSFYWQYAVLKKYKKIKKVKQQSSQIGEWISDVIVGV